MRERKRRVTLIDRVEKLEADVAQIRKTVYGRMCPVCGEPVEGPKHKKYCSNACKVRACRMRKAGRESEIVAECAT